MFDYFYNLKKIPLILILCLPCFTVLADNDEYSEMDLDELVEVKVYAASVLTAHIHEKDDLMISFDYMQMHMDGNGVGTEDVSIAELLDPNGEYGYMMAPLHMDMVMNMVMIMYAPSDDWTLMLMPSYKTREMTMQMRGMGSMPGGTSYIESAGVDDTWFKANYVMSSVESDFGEQEWGLNLAISIPTGSIDEKNALGEQLPYTMQIGSGTYDFQIGAMYSELKVDWYWGMQALATFHTGENDNHYVLGDEIIFKAWLNRSWSDNFSSFIRLDARDRKQIEGHDRKIPEIMETRMPTADHTLSASKLATFTFGSDFSVASESGTEHTFGFEFGKPIFQDLVGPQMKTEWSARISWQMIF